MPLRGDSSDPPPHAVAPRTAMPLARYLVAALPPLVLFLLLPTRNYYWDGVLFSLKIEQATWPQLATLVHPNHLLYTVLGFLVYRPVHALWPAARALACLQVLNSFAGAGCAALLVAVADRLFAPARRHLWLAWLLSFGATWWKFAIDADAYILCALFLLCAANHVLAEPPVRLWPIALWHVAAMLMHQLAVLFYAPVLVSLVLDHRTPRTRLLQFGRYLAASALPVAAAYGAAYRVLFAGQPHTPPFSAWFTSYSSEVAFTFNPLSFVPVSLQSYAKLFLGGRFDLYRSTFGPLSLAATLIALAALVMAALHLARDYTAGGLSLRLFARRFAAPAHRRVRAILLAWIGAFALFLAVWLPANTFYKLLFWPALVLFFGLLATERPHPSARAGILVPLVLLVAGVNFAAFIYPGAHTDANPLVQFSLDLRRRLPPGAHIVYAEFAPDNWFVRYFNPQTVWDPLACDSAAACRVRLIALGAQARELWLDPSAQQRLQAFGVPDPAAGQGIEVTAQAELVDAKRRIRFVRIAAR